MLPLSRISGRAAKSLIKLLIRATYTGSSKLVFEVSTMAGCFVIYFNGTIKVYMSLTSKNVVACIILVLNAYETSECWPSLTWMLAMNKLEFFRFDSGGFRGGSGGSLEPPLRYSILLYENRVDPCHAGSYYKSCMVWVCSVLGKR